MSTIKTCKTCGTPLSAGRGHVWNTNGTISQRRDPDHRMALIDSNGINTLFANIEQLIGVPIENIITESKARATGAYISKMMHGTRGTLARVVGIERIVRRVVEQGRVMGYGDIKVREVSWKKNYLELEIGNPYSLPLFIGDMKGVTRTIKPVTGTETHEEIGPDRYLVKAFQAPHPLELEDRLFPKPKPVKPGNIELKRCDSCGAPLEVSRFHWDLDKGTITEPDTGLRVAILGPDGLQAILDELEEELGEAIPETIVEAQRRYVTATTSSFYRSLREDDFRYWLALFGLGNLVSIEKKDGGVSARIENPGLPLVIAGTWLGLYELASGAKGAIDWSLSEDGDLNLKIAPQT